MNRSVNEYHRKQQLRKLQAAGLAVLFLLVMWFQFGRSPNEANSENTPSASRASTTTTGEPTIETPKSHHDAVELPRLPIEQIIAANPFSKPLPEPTIEPEPEPEPQQIPIELPPAPAPIAPPSVAAIYKTPTGWAALVDRQVVRPGDHLPTGYRILDVTSTGIRVGPAE